LDENITDNPEKCRASLFVLWQAPPYTVKREEIEGGTLAFTPKMPIAIAIATVSYNRF